MVILEYLSVFRDFIIFCGELVYLIILYNVTMGLFSFFNNDKSFISLGLLLLFKLFLWIDNVVIFLSFFLGIWDLKYRIWIWFDGCEFLILFVSSLFFLMEVFKFIDVGFVFFLKVGFKFLFVCFIIFFMIDRFSDIMLFLLSIRLLILRVLKGVFFWFVWIKRIFCNIFLIIFFKRMGVNGKICVNLIKIKCIK